MILFFYHSFSSLLFFDIVFNFDTFKLILTILGAPAIVIGLYRIFIPRKKELTYCINNTIFLDNSDLKLKNLSIQYTLNESNNSEQFLDNIKTITKSRIFFWNSGNQPVNYNNDIVPAIGIEILLSDLDEKIISIDMLSTLQLNTNNANNINFNNIVLNYNNLLFEFLNPKDGVILDVLHTGSINDYPLLKGYVKNSKINEEINLIYLENIQKFRNFISGISFTFQLIFLLSLPPLFIKLNSTKILDLPFWLYIVLFLFLLVLSSIFRDKIITLTTVEYFKISDNMYKDFLTLEIFDFL